MKIDYDSTKHFAPRVGEYVVYGYTLTDGENEVSEEVAEFLKKENLLRDKPSRASAK